jgi:hypothetical protein
VARSSVGASVIAVGVGGAHAPSARVTLLSTSASVQTLAGAIREAAKLRLAAGMRWSVMRSALKLPPAENTTAAWAATWLHSRKVDLDVARSALRWHVQHYATPTAILEQMREERILSVPDLETIAHCDGTRRSDPGQGRPARSAAERACGRSVVRRDRSHARIARRSDGGAPLARRIRKHLRARTAARALDVLRRPRDHAARRISGDRQGIWRSARFRRRRSRATISRSSWRCARRRGLVERAWCSSIRGARPLHPFLRTSRG